MLIAWDTLGYMVMRGSIVWDMLESVVMGGLIVWLPGHSLLVYVCEWSDLFKHYKN